MHTQEGTLAAFAAFQSSATALIISNPTQAVHACTCWYMYAPRQASTPPINLSLGEEQEVFVPRFFRKAGLRMRSTCADEAACSTSPCRSGRGMGPCQRVPGFAGRRKARGSGPCRLTGCVRSHRHDLACVLGLGWQAHTTRDNVVLTGDLTISFP